MRKIHERDKALVCDVQDIFIHEHSWGPRMATQDHSASPFCGSYGQLLLQFSHQYGAYPSTLGSSVLQVSLVYQGSSITFL